MATELMSSIRYVLIASLLTGCLADTQSTDENPEVALADVQSKLLFAVSSDSVVIDVSGGGCPRLPADVTATLDGIPGTIDRGGIETTGYEDFGHPYEDCHNAGIAWRGLPPIAGATTIEISDSKTTWTIVVDRPTTPRTYTGLSPNATVHTGDLVTLELTPSGTLLAAGITVNGASIPTTKTASTIQFTVPTVAEPTTTTFAVFSQYALPTPTCDAPGGCGSVLHASPSIAVIVAP